MFNLRQLEEIALVLENESKFHREYATKRPGRNDTYGRRRAIIADWLVTTRTTWAVPRVNTWPRWVGQNAVEDRDQLRRYFDERYGIPQNEINKYADIPSLMVEDLSEPTKEPPMTWKEELAAARVRGATIQMLRDSGTWVDERTEGMTSDYDFSLRQAKYRIKPGTDPLEQPLPVHVPGCPIPIPSPEYLAEWQASQQPQESTMTKPIEITITTFVNGTDISKMADGEVFNLIASEEAVIEDLKKIKAQPKKLVAEIAKREAGIAALVAYLDSKEA